MYGPPGIAYVYLVYGMHDCLNVVTESPGHPAAVLVRAVEPLDAASAEGMRRARLRRLLARIGAAERDVVRKARARLDRIADARIASGPGLVAAAFGLTRADTGMDLLDPQAPVRLEVGRPPDGVAATPRIGIDYAPEPWRSLPWRFLDPGSGAVSGTRPRGSAS
jgi:DNA-3-methyladenine glycosylase